MVRWRAWMLAVVVAGIGSAAAQSPAGGASPTDDRLDAARRQVDALQSRLSAGDRDALDLGAIRADAIELQKRTQAIATELAPQLADVQERQTLLGPAPAASAAAEPSDVAAQRRSLEAGRSRLDAEVRLARLLAAEGGQLVDRVDELRRNRFEAQLGERTPALLAPAFWSELASSWSHDRPRLAALGRDLATAAAAVDPWRWLVALAIAALAIGAVPVVTRALQSLAATRLPHGRLRRSLLALGRALAPPAAALVAGHAIRFAVVSGGAATPAVTSVLDGLVAAVAFGTYVAALGRAMMSASRPSWRLPPIPDAIATGLRRVPLVLGAAIAVGWMLERLAAVVNTGLATTVAINCLFSIALGWLLVSTVVRSERLRRGVLASADADQVPRRPGWLSAAIALSWATLVVSLVCLLVGYVALGSFVVKQVAWILIVGNSAWLLAAVVDDVCDAAFAVADEDTPALRRQVAVLLSAAGRIAIVVLALVAVLGRLGQDPAELVQRAIDLRQGIAFGEIRLLPGAVLEGLAILVAGIVAVRLLQGWLLDRYLPTTTLDAGMRTSAVTLLGYVGMVVAVALALSAIGFGLERIAWVASALSVGIGFGLQAVVSNFVSGLILLTERPVKVGDWVSLGGVEGDIRRINVRATEIQMSDRSTLVVPNSEFITKIVRNVTHGSPAGLVQLKLPLPLDCDAERVRQVLLDAMAAQADVLETPAPQVLLDGVDGSNLVFAATASVASPRRVAAVRSALLFDSLARLRAAGIALGQPPALVLREPAPG